MYLQISFKVEFVSVQSDNMCKRDFFGFLCLTKVVLLFVFLARNKFGIINHLRSESVFGLFEYDRIAALLIKNVVMFDHLHSFKLNVVDTYCNFMQIIFRLL